MMIAMQDAPTPITPRGRPINAAAGLPMDAPRLAGELLRTLRAGALSTLDSGSGYPYGAVTNVATDHDGSPIFLLVWPALHTRNIQADNRVALTLANLGRGDALAQPRLTLVGRAVMANDDEVDRFRRRYLARHPKAKLYMTLPDARFHRLDIEALQLSGGPGRNAAVLTPKDILTDVAGAAALVGAEAAEIERINACPADLAYVVACADLRPSRWKVTGIDPAGIDLTSGDDTGRLWFGRQVLTVEDLRAVSTAKPGKA